MQWFVSYITIALESDGPEAACCPVKNNKLW